MNYINQNIQSKIIVSTTSTTEEKCMMSPLGQTSFLHFAFIVFSAEDCKTDRAMRPLQILSDDQLILYKESQNILNLFPMVFLKMKDSGAMTIYFLLKKTCEGNNSEKNSEGRNIKSL